ncbi:hypothetical protein [Paenibacillus lentus]|uniref:Uncharacterized protein n=1 Tax=Paenibacillus lentus TaxID=1338368 RepID=A0A3S8RR62_9BACL|nr:hypothetical protein [Paenibacillus lentus]AZK45313.1 hypothetical protein EIM92_03095 [Paenibacillus lentus]
MKTRISSNMILKVVFTIIVLFVLFYKYIPQHTTFQKVVSDKISLSEVEEIRIIKTSYTTSKEPKQEEVVIHESDQIKSIMNSFKDLQLTTVVDPSIKDSTTVYHLYIQVSKESRFLLNFYDGTILEVYDSKAKKRLTNYKIKNDYSPDNDIGGYLDL